jgi:hypothetical protein
METGTMAFAVLACITAHFRDNQQERAGYLGQNFHNIEQVNNSVTDYCLDQLRIPSLTSAPQTWMTP